MKAPTVKESVISPFFILLYNKKRPLSRKNYCKNKWPLTAVSLHLPAKGHLWSLLVSNIICISSLSSSTFSIHHTHSKSINSIFLYGEYPYAFLAHLWTRIKAKVSSDSYYSKKLTWTLSILMPSAPCPLHAYLGLLSLPACVLFDRWSSVTASSYSSLWSLWVCT